MRITIHQPEHLPWLGFLDKMRQADLLVVLDTVQYRRRYFQNRNRIRTPDGWQWITIPVESESRDHTRIRDVRLAPAARRSIRKNLESIRQHYSRAAYFDDYFEAFAAIYEAAGSDLCEWNCRLIRHVFEAFGIHCDMVLASKFSPMGQKSELILDLCRRAGATTYLSGISGKEYLDLKAFDEADVGVEFQEFHHPVYSQTYDGFEPCMSAIDLLFNEGSRSGDILAGQGVAVLSEVFT